MASPLHALFAKELPSVWRADELARPVGGVVATGHAALDAQLPAGGWPVGAIVEVLQAHSGQNEWRLLLPGLTRTADGPLVLVGAPHVPFGPGLVGQGLSPQRLLCINTATPASRLWATEQALRCKEVVAVLAWLPQVRADQLRRLQIAAAEHAKLLFVMRPAQAQSESSPAVLRLLLSLQTDSDALELRILKRRGPPLEQPLVLPARAARLSALLALSRGAEREQAQVQTPEPTKDMSQANVHPAPQEASVTTPPTIASLHMFKRRNHALDRIAAAA